MIYKFPATGYWTLRLITQLAILLDKNDLRCLD